jgi:hypothetical protein
MGDPTPVRYDLQLSLLGLPAGGAAEVQVCLEEALAESISEGIVVVSSVTEHPAAALRCPLEQHITPFSTLYLALPAEYQRAEILDALAERYYHELACLRRSIQDDRCIQGVVELRGWRTAGTQWICEFLSYDKSIPAGRSWNFHLQDTSQWHNQATGWCWHQGAIVLDTLSGELSAYH